MFNLYQTLNQKEQKESETIGHDRFYQERPSRSSFRKKKKPLCRRAQSAAEFNPTSIAAANKRMNFRTRSVSSENEDEQPVNAGAVVDKSNHVTHKIDSLAKLLFNKSLMGNNSPGGSLKGSPVEENKGMFKSDEKGIPNNGICIQFLENNTRYEYISDLSLIGSRSDKFWFGIKDCSIKAERLLMMVPLRSSCPIEPTEKSRKIIIELFRALHHPYIYPVLDVCFYGMHALSIIPFNPTGSLKDLIYKTNWRDGWQQKYGRSHLRTGLPLLQICRLGRQILEGLLFLGDRGFPPFRHLHSGNIMIQNGVARISGLENTLLGLPPKNGVHNLESSTNPESISFGHLLFEMCASYELDCPAPTPAHLQIELENYPQIAEILETIFSTQPPMLADLVLLDIFRKIDLREMKGSCLPNFNQRLTGSCTNLLNQVARGERVVPAAGRSHRSFLSRSAGCSPSVTPQPRRKHYTTDDFDSSWHY